MSYKHREDNSSYNRDRNLALRTQAIEIYGGCCESCGARASLEFHHVNGDGEEHRKTERPYAMYLRIARSGQPIRDRELQLLCTKCHIRVTPHMRRLPRARDFDWNDSEWEEAA